VSTSGCVLTYPCDHQDSFVVVSMLTKYLDNTSTISLDKMSLKGSLYVQENNQLPIFCYQLLSVHGFLYCGLVISYFCIMHYMMSWPIFILHKYIIYMIRLYEIHRICSKYKSKIKFKFVCVIVLIYTYILTEIKFT
jgi:hypothetical protein